MKKTSRKYSTALFFFHAGFTPSPVSQPQPSAGLNVDFESVFGNKSSNVVLDSGGKTSTKIDDTCPRSLWFNHMTMFQLTKESRL